LWLVGPPSQGLQLETLGKFKKFPQNCVEKATNKRSS